MIRFARFVFTGVMFASFTVTAYFAQISSAWADARLKDPPICSSFEPVPKHKPFGCEVTPKGKDKNNKPTKTIKINLTAQTKEITIGGHKVKTENYGTYLPPVVEARAGDTVEVTLTNDLAPREHSGDAAAEHRHHCEPDSDHPDGPPAGSNPTNLHYFHGGIVTPANGNSDGVGIPKGNVDRGGSANSARWGTGDNIYSCLERGQKHTFSVPIPGHKGLNAAVLEGKKGDKIAHPTGLNWYHSHLHGISSNQVMGGMAGLLSVGRRDENLRAHCEDPGSIKCMEDTETVRENTLVKYGLLRDISLKKKNGNWIPDPDGQNFGSGRVCGVLREEGVTFDTGNTGLRKGFCQPNQIDDETTDVDESELADPNKLWLFTINGQKFPTIEVDETKTGVLLRLGNLSPNFAYWLELYDEKVSKPAEGKFVRKNMTIVSVDGVVPAKPQSAADDDEQISVASYEVPDLLLMPASRVEIYIDRRGILPSQEKTFILRTKELKTGLVPKLRLGIPGDGMFDLEKDQWPEVQLARIMFKKSDEKPLPIALNAPVAEQVVAAFDVEVVGGPRKPPPGCMRDLREGEYRKVEFTTNGNKNEVKADWKIITSIMKNGSVVKDESNNPLIIDTPFEAYVNEDNSIKWDGGDSNLLHTCIQLYKRENAKPQLWELSNSTADLHNFHIHQMKFRLATVGDLKRHGIVPPPVSSVCDGVTNCDGPDYKFYEPDTPKRRSVSSLGRAALEGNSISSIIEWHDTIPMPPFSVTVPEGRPEESSPVYVMMSFVDDAQVGRFVYHCHILKHEDSGLMAPIEVWDPEASGTLN